jgi:hypothetical protein
MAQENDIVLVYFENKPLFFARIEAISPDIKPDWYHVKLLVLQTPLQFITWILRDVYINGEEFTMGGKKIRMEKVVCPEEKKTVSSPETKRESFKKSHDAEIISLADLKKNRIRR